MRRILLAITLVVASCVTELERPIAERLIGSWEQEVSVLGRRKVSVLTFCPDGRFVESTSVRTTKGTVPEASLPGRWRAQDAELHLDYLTGFTGHGGPETEVRQVSQLTKTTFSSADVRFGIQVERRRVADAKEGCSPFAGRAATRAASSLPED